MSNKKIILKNIFIALLAVIMVFSFATCGAKPSGSDSGSATETENTLKDEASKNPEKTGEDVSQDSTSPADGSRVSGSEAEGTDDAAGAAGGNENANGDIQTKGKYPVYLSYIDQKALEDGRSPVLVRNVRTLTEPSGDTLECNVKDIISALSVTGSEDQTTVLTDEFYVESVDGVDRTVVIKLGYKGDHYLQTYDLRCLVYQITDSVIHSLQKHGLDYRNVKIVTDSGFLSDDEFDITDGCFDLDDCDEFSGA